LKGKEDRGKGEDVEGGKRGRLEERRQGEERKMWIRGQREVQA